MLHEFKTAIRTWAAQRADIRGVALVGSHARGTATEKSDVDIIMLCEQPAALEEDVSWVQAFGSVEHLTPEQYGYVRFLRVHYANGLEVEFGLNPLKWVSMPLDKGTRRVLSDGVEVLYDPSGLLDQAVSALRPERDGT